MNQELTPTEQQLAEQAAKAQSQIEREYIAGIPRKPNEQDIVDSFKAGIDYALSYILPSRLQQATTSPDILREILKPFAEWLLENYQQADGATVWKDRWRRSGTIYTFLEVIEKYIHHLQTNKDKEDARP